MSDYMAGDKQFCLLPDWRGRAVLHVRTWCPDRHSMSAGFVTGWEWSDWSPVTMKDYPLCWHNAQNSLSGTYR